MIADAAKPSPVAPEQPLLRVQKTVLIIEDDAAFRDLLALHLSRAGYQVLVAEDAAAGGPMLLSARPDLLLLDILLPYLGGLELLEAMRHDPEVGQTPVVCVTSMRDDATYIRAMELGAEAVLTKPVRVEELLATTARVMKAARTVGGQDGLK